MRHTMRSLIAIVLVMTFSGCSLFMPHSQTVTVTTSERDAEIYINGNLEGVGTASAVVKRNENVTIMAKKKGFYPATRNITKTMSPVGIVDVIGGVCFLLPFIGLMSPGAWELQTTNVTVLMSKKENDKDNE